MRFVQTADTVHFGGVIRYFAERGERGATRRALRSYVDSSRHRSLVELCDFAASFRVAFFPAGEKEKTRASQDVTCVGLSDFCHVETQ